MKFQMRVYAHDGHVVVGGANVKVNQHLLLPAALHLGVEGGRLGLWG